MNQLTKGEWKVCTEKFNAFWRGDGTEVYSDYGRIASTYVNGLREIDECIANARLIAAAPDLLEALKSLSKVADSYSLGNTVTMARALAAIAKAEQP